MHGRPITRSISFRAAKKICGTTHRRTSRTKGRVFACGRDPYFPAWPDVLQLNAFHRRFGGQRWRRSAKIAGPVRWGPLRHGHVDGELDFREYVGRPRGRTPLHGILGRCDPGDQKPLPGFLFIAETYWDLEWALQQQGFDFCYDKRLYDRLEHGSGEPSGCISARKPPIRRSWFASSKTTTSREPRQHFRRQGARSRGVTAHASGGRLFHEGQFDGRKVKVPVFLGRRPAEREDRDLRVFYRKLLRTVDSPVFRNGQWSLCERTGWPGNPSFQNLVAWNWTIRDGRCLVVVNLSDSPVQARVHVPWQDAHGSTWVLSDPLSGANDEREGD